MKSRFVTFVIVFITIVGQSQPKVALTSGSESLTPNNPYEQYVSITENPPDYPYAYYQAPAESVIKQGTGDPVTNTPKKSSKETFILFTGILIAVAIYFITKKNRQATTLATIQKLETEEELELRKEMWDQMATGDEDETKDSK